MTWQGHPVMSPNQYLELTQDIRINSYVTNSGNITIFQNWLRALWYVQGSYAAQTWLLLSWWNIISDGSTNVNVGVIKNLYSTLATKALQPSKE